MGAKNPQISKTKRCYAAKSLYLGRSLSDFDEIWHTDALDLLGLFDCEKFEIL